ncbi:MAG: SAM-dependent methyltransferase [Candidatus Hydrothermarchaeaceae archaeon]
MHLLITTPSGFEREAIDELKKILKGTRIRTTYFRGLLLGETEKDRGEIVQAVRENETEYIHRVIPIEKIVPSDLEKIKEFFSSASLKGKRFAVRCRRRGIHEFSSGKIESEIGAMLREEGVVDLEKPEIVCIVEILQDYCGLAIISPDEIVNKKSGITRKWKEGERPVSRAELKMREIVERFPAIFRRECVVLDVGAAPGGWSRVMAGCVKKVIAVDPGELDKRVEKIENVEHVKERGENLRLNEKVDIITNDANILHMQAAGVSIKLAKKFLKRGGYLIHTVKLGIVPKTGKMAAKNLSEAVAEVTQELQNHGIKIVHVVKLKYNTRNECTLIGRK